MAGYMGWTLQIRWRKVLRSLNRITANNRLPYDQLRNVISDNDKQLWILTYNNIYLKYNYSLKQFETVPVEQVDPNTQLLLENKPEVRKKYKTLNGIQYFISDDFRFTSHNPRTGQTTDYKSNLWQPGKLLRRFYYQFFISTIRRLFG